MKRTFLLLALLVVLTTQVSYGQNTFPATGNVGIRTLNPQFPLHIKQSNNHPSQGIAVERADNGNAGSMFYGSDDNMYFWNHGEGGFWFTSNGINGMVRISPTGNVGIGASPLYQLHIKQTSNSHVGQGIAVERSDTGSIGSMFYGSDNNLYLWNHDPDGGFWLSNNRHNGMVRVSPAGDVGIGASPDPDYKLSVLGSLRAKEVVVESGWSDFVFEKDYNLMPLDELDQYINENGRLPEIPSASDVEENGVNVGAMNAKLLQKIEELTLYVIAGHKEIQSLKEENERMKAEYASLAERVSALEMAKQ